MNTNLIQSQLHRNASIITLSCKRIAEARADAKAAQLAQSRKYHRAKAAKLSATVSKLSAIQFGLKAEIKAMKLSRATKKHGKEDARYLAWAGRDTQVV